MFERAGATALQLEDQSFPKRCGHLTDKAVIPAGEMAGKIKAAVDARASENTLIVARIDAVAVERIRAEQAQAKRRPRSRRLGGAGLERGRDAERLSVRQSGRRRPLGRLSRTHSPREAGRAIVEALRPAPRCC
jgi:hypothetical protein